MNRQGLAFLCIENIAWCYWCLLWHNSKVLSAVSSYLKCHTAPWLGVSRDDLLRDCSEADCAVLRRHLWEPWGLGFMLHSHSSGLSCHSLSLFPTASDPSPHMGLFPHLYSLEKPAFSHLHPVSCLTQVRWDSPFSSNLYFLEQSQITAYRCQWPGAWYSRPIIEGFHHIGFVFVQLLWGVQQESPPSSEFLRFIILTKSLAWYRQ